MEVIKKSMLAACRANDFDFFLPWLESGHLTVGQMHHAAERYQLGKTKSGQPMFWMIDDRHEPLDAHIANGTWLSTLLKAREPELLECWHARHCLFGEHLLKNEKMEKLENEKTVAIVEKEQSAVILSELFPESIWMAYVTLLHLDIDRFAPLQERNVIIYPPTDPAFSTFLFFDELAVTIHQHYGIHISVSSILEDHATEDQKQRCIDILGFIQEDSTSAP